MLYEQKVKYLEYRESGTKVKGAGFIKLERWGEAWNLLLQISGLPAGCTGEKGVYLCEGRREILLSLITLEQGRGRLEFHEEDSRNTDGDDMTLAGAERIRIPVGPEKEVVAVLRDETDLRKEEKTTAEILAPGAKITERYRDGESAAGFRGGELPRDGGLREGLREGELRREEGPATGFGKEGFGRERELAEGLREGELQRDVVSIEESRREKILIEESPVKRTLGEELRKDVVSREELKMHESRVEESLIEETPIEETPIEENRMEEGQSRKAETAGEETSLNAASWDGEPAQRILRDECLGGNLSVKENAGEKDLEGKAQRKEGETFRDQAQPYVFQTALQPDKWEQLRSIYPPVRPFGDDREYLRISPGDFVILKDRSYRLANNSFLLHGYFNYKHLILHRTSGKGEDAYFVGVPGNFYDKEKEVAILFGFESFECAREPAREGDYGYYMMRVEL